LEESGISARVYLSQRRDVHRSAGISIPSFCRLKIDYTVLTLVVYHHGKYASGGHYTVDVLRQDRKSWVRIDDTNIQQIRASSVAVEVSEDEWWEDSEGGEWWYDGKEKDRCAYLLFFERA